ncbi:MAG: isoleucine--tRNA ligase [Proteobacteria bacterium]|nr:isoleucine--tRNA ligase [Pseudomonadota bacterium]
MTEYKHTLNLPKTDFPMKANLSQREGETLKIWEDSKLYSALRAKRKGAEKFVLHDGPPYANGHIHIGHALNKILKDMIIKSKSLSGYDSPYVPGWDCHGLPIELNIEKKYGKAGDKISEKEFRQHARKYANEFIDIQKEEFKRLGVLGDWDNPYTTMDYHYEANIIRALGKIIENGHLQPGFKPVHWCMDCQSALAEAEVEYQDKTSPSIDVRFTVVDEKELLTKIPNHPTGKGSISFPIWTTTPWTLPANQAVALNPDLPYVLVQTPQERLLLAEALLETALQRFGMTDYEVMATVPGSIFENILLQHPFYDRKVPVVLGDHVTIETGTGAVHTAPGHGPDDYIIGLRYKLPIDNPVGPNGCFLPSTPLFAGEHINKANDHIIEVLREKRKLLDASKLQHSYPHCWRHKTPVIFLATPQWFVSMEKNHLRQSILKAIATVEWIPGWGEAHIAGMVEGRPDWCISRQRSWGTPMTLFMHKETKQLHPKTSEFIEKVATLIDEKGIDAWFDLKPEELLGSDAEHYEKVTDVLDVWFDAGVSHFAVLSKRPELKFPADVYLEGSDQHRGWFNSSITTSVAMQDAAPYRQVVTHGFTVDAQGRKMSKSLGNIIAPEKIIKTFGADILRLWVSSTDYPVEQAISDEILQRTSDAYRRIRNTTRFLLSNLFDFEPKKDLVPSEQLLVLDRWAIDRARLLQEEIRKAYDSYEFHLIYQMIHNFCSIDMGSFYLDIIKDRQYTMATNSLGRRSCQTAMFHIAEALVCWLAPILSFTAEEIWKYLPGERESSVFLTTWYENFVTLEKDTAMNAEFWDRIIQVRDVVNKELEVKRNEGIIGSGLAADVTIYCRDQWHVDLEKLKNELRFVLITSSATVASADHPKGVETEIPGLFVEVRASADPKCVRCWHRRGDVGVDDANPELCQRCVENVVGSGEQRLFA